MRTFHRILSRLRHRQRTAHQTTHQRRQASIRIHRSQTYLASLDSLQRSSGQRRSSARFYRPLFAVRWDRRRRRRGWPGARRRRREPFRIWRAATGGAPLRRRRCGSCNWPPVGIGNVDDFDDLWEGGHAAQYEACAIVHCATRTNSAPGETKKRSSPWVRARETVDIFRAPCRRTCEYDINAQQLGHLLAPSLRGTQHPLAPRAARPCGLHPAEFARAFPRRVVSRVVTGDR